MDFFGEILDTKWDAWEDGYKVFAKIFFLFTINFHHWVEAINCGVDHRGKKNNLFAKCNFLHDRWRRYLSSGAWKFSIKLSKCKTEVIYSNWNEACHKATASLVPVVVVVICGKTKKTKTKLRFIQIFVVINSKLWRPAEACVGDCASCIKGIFRQFLFLC